MSAITPKALEADCTAPTFGPTRPSVLAMRGFRFANDDDGAKPKPADPQKPDPTEEDDDDELDLARAKAKIAKANREAAALRKERDELAKKAKEADDAEKSDLTKAQEALAEAQKQVETLTLQNARLEVAIEKKLTVKQANRLSGATRDELEADADDFLADLGGGEQDKKAPPTKQPREALRGGGDPTAHEDAEPTAAEAADAILANP